MTQPNPSQTKPRQHNTAQHNKTQPKNQTKPSQAKPSQTPTLTPPPLFPVQPNTITNTFFFHWVLSRQSHDRPDGLTYRQSIKNIIKKDGGGARGAFGVFGRGLCGRVAASALQVTSREGGRENKESGMGGVLRGRGMYCMQYQLVSRCEIFVQWALSSQYPARRV